MARRGGTGSGSGPGRRTSRRASGNTGRSGAAPRRAGARPPAGRPGARRTRAPRPRGRLTGRAVVLALVFVALVLAYAYPVRTYLAQRSEIARLTQSQQEQRKRIAALRAERDKWNDPRYVEAQARAHLRMVRPGDRVYSVYDDPNAGKKRDRDPARVRSTGPWYGKLWSSVRGADGHPS